MLPSTLGHYLFLYIYSISAWKPVFDPDFQSLGYGASRGGVSLCDYNYLLFEYMASEYLVGA